MAHGSATSGFEKFCCASTTPSAEFCIPTSIEIVRDADSRFSQNQPKIYPKTNPLACNVNTAPTSLKPASTTLCRVAPMIEATIKVMARTAISGATGRMRRLMLGKRHLRKAPPMTGRITTCTVSSTSLPIEPRRGFRQEVPSRLAS